jgi:hypothetical protein
MRLTRCAAPRVNPEMMFLDALDYQPMQSLSDESVHGCQVKYINKPSLWRLKFSDDLDAKDSGPDTEPGCRFKCVVEKRHEKQ